MSYGEVATVAGVVFTAITQFVGFAILFGRYAQRVETVELRLDKIEIALERTAEVQTESAVQMAAFAERMEATVSRIGRLEH